MSGHEVTRNDGQVYAVRLPEWLSADERRRIVAEANAFVAGMFQAISAGGLGAYSARVSAEVAGRLDAAGIDARALGELLGCSRRWAAGLLAGRRPWSLDDLAMVADRLGVEVMALAAPGVEVQRTDGDDEVEGRRYATRDECVAREIVEPLGEYAAEHDVEAIADEVVESDGRAFWVAVDVPTFWKVAQRHAVG